VQDLARLGVALVIARGGLIEGELLERAERQAVMQLKVQQKVSGSFRSDRGGAAGSPRNPLHR